MILFAHGSADPRWCAPFEQLADRLRWEVGESRVGLAYMEFAAPTLFDAVEQAVRDGIDDLQLLPLFLSAGGHVSRDIPAQVEDAHRRFPDIQIEVRPPIGEDKRFRELICSIAIETLSD